MHELALIERVVQRVLGQIDVPIARLTLEVGERAGIDVGALRFCYAVCTEQTVLETASLELRVVAGAELRIKEVEVVT